MSAIDREKLREAIATLQGWVGESWGILPQVRIVCVAAEAHLSTLPKTKEVEVWHVEWTDNSNPTSEWKVRSSGPFVSEENAEACAAGLRVCKTVGCVRVTGPHKQTVPA